MTRVTPPPGLLVWIDRVEAEAVDPVDQVAALDSIDVMVRDLGALRSGLEAALIAAVGAEGNGELVLPDGRRVGTEWVKGSVKWDTPKLWPHMAAVAAANDADPVDVLGECAAVSYWRVGKLKSWGVDPDGFRELNAGKTKMVLLPPA